MNSAIARPREGGYEILIGQLLTVKCLFLCFYVVYILIGLKCLLQEFWQFTCCFGATHFGLGGGRKLKYQLHFLHDMKIKLGIVF